MVKNELLAHKALFKSSFSIITAILTITYTVDYLAFNPTNSQEDFNHKLYWMICAVGTAGFLGMLLMFLAFFLESGAKRSDKFLIPFIVFILFLSYSALSRDLTIILVFLPFIFFALIFSDWCLGRGRAYKFFLVFVLSIILSTGAFGVELVLWNLFIPLLPIIFSQIVQEPMNLEYLEVLLLFLLFVGIMIAFLRRIDSVLNKG